ncbi:MAG: Wzz/FepE/Etk N-terminal domain-containing protein [Pseudonocardiaceae bacterium]
MTTTSTSSTPEPLLDLQRLVAGIRWRRRIWVSIGLLGLLAGALLAVLVPPPPTAVARLLIIHENDQESVSGSLMETDVALLETTRIAAATLERINAAERPEDFLKSYAGEGLTGNVLELTVSGSSDRDAVLRAQALAEVFIADHIQRTETAANAEAQALIDRRAQVENELAEVDDSIAATTAGAAGGTAADLDARYARRAELTAQIQDLGQRAEEAGTGAPRVAVGTQIADSPHAVTDSIVVTGVMNAVVGLVLGLGAGLALAAVASVVQDRPVLRRDIAAHLGASVIAQLPAPRRGPARLWRRSRGVAQRERVAATLVRTVRDAPGAVSLLELGCPRTAAALALDIAEELAVDRPVVVVDDLPGRNLRELTRKTERPIRILDGAERPVGRPSPLPQPERHLGVGSVGPGTAWTDLRQLGSETLLVVRTGHVSTPWLHTVARQLADAQIPVIGVVLVHPDPRDRSDGTLWDALHTALRGRGARRPGSTPSDNGFPTDALPAVGSTTTPEATKTAEVS